MARHVETVSASSMAETTCARTYAVNHDFVHFLFIYLFIYMKFVSSDSE